MSPFNIKINSLEEICMGGYAYGIAIECNGRTIDGLWNTTVVIASQSLTNVDAEESTDGRYLVVRGTYATYVFDLIDMTISLFRATIRSHRDILVEENPVLGTSVRNITGVSGNNYSVKYPFVRSEEFNATWQKYERQRIIQILQLRKTIPSVNLEK